MSVTTNRPLATRQPSNPRARRIREEREAVRRQRRNTVVLVMMISVVGAALVMLLARALTGCADGLLVAQLMG